MLKELKNYIIDNKFKINIWENQIHIINYLDIEHFDDKEIVIKIENKKIKIKGEELIITKLLEEELLINGKIRNIEFNE